MTTPFSVKTIAALTGLIIMTGCNTTDKVFSGNSMLHLITSHQITPGSQIPQGPVSVETMLAKARNTDPATGESSTIRIHDIDIRFFPAETLPSHPALRHMADRFSDIGDAGQFHIEIIGGPDSRASGHAGLQRVMLRAAEIRRALPRTIKDVSTRFDPKVAKDTVVIRFLPTSRKDQDDA